MSEYYVESEAKIMSENGTEFFLQTFSLAGGQVNPHIHSAVEMLYVAHGAFQFFAENRELRLGEGEAILFRSHTIHRACPLAEGSSYYVLKWHPSFILSISSAAQGVAYLLRLAQYHESAKVAWSREECERSGLAACIARLTREEREQGYGGDIAKRIAAAEILLILLRDIESMQPTAQLPDAMQSSLARRIYDTTVYVQKHYAEELSAEECARRAAMSYSYFSRSFKRLTGKPFKDYLAAVRIRHAEKALLTTDKPITEIATACGFNSVAYFSATYKRLQGVTPTAVRRP